MWRAIRKSLFFTLGILLIIALFASGSIYYFSRDLPSLQELERFEPDVVSTVYDINGQVLTEFGIKNRTLVPLDSIPDHIKNAILATEDRQFYDHWGMDMRRFVKAVWMNLTRGFGSQGASTLTQQLARTLHLNRQETIKRKIQELLVAILIERTYSKTEILEMYLNSVFWGHGCYGIQAATDYYFSKTVQELTLDESAMLIGILPSPTPWSPRFYHDRAIRRRNLVLRNMIRTGKISQQEFVDALSQETPVNHIENKSLAPYFTEFIRIEVAAFCRQQGIDYYRDGLSIFTTLDLKMQEIAQASVREQLAEQQLALNLHLLSDPGQLLRIYREYYPYQRIPLRFFADYSIVAIRPNEEAPSFRDNPVPYNIQVGDTLLALSPLQSELRNVLPVMAYDSLLYQLLPDDLRGAPLTQAVYQPFVFDTLYRDSTYYRYFLEDSLFRDSITFDARTWYTIVVDSSSLIGDSLLAALPLKPKTVQAAIYTMDSQSGAIRVMVGGRDFEESKFNRAVQARRQPGSTFKPFVFTSVIDNGYSPATQLLNQPPAIPQPDGKLWIPSNFDRSTGGLMTLREGLKHSVNLISANAITQLTTPEIVIDYARKMGISTELPAYPSLSLGSGEVLLSDMVSAYGVFANKGIWNRPYAIERILDRNGREIYRSPRETREVLSTETTFLMVDMLKSVIKDGTGLRVHAAYSFRAPCAGKTGTTNDFTDAWFVGFTPLLVSGVWVGVDDARISLGPQQTGSRAALPIWAAFMRESYRAKQYPYLDFEQPSTVRKFRICSVSKKIPNSFCPVEQEFFNVRHAPKEECDIHGFEVKEGSSGIDF
ncbi:MAG: PBP1A family penicillin-binding protein [Candidatus Marinimicrobia bacterium]|nr:PBP1A family penicillin-binding protein [Candidatus Neomarinimicrobiota bacterium]